MHVQNRAHCCAGVEWKTLNAAQKQLRRDMMLLYGTPRPLLRGRLGFKVENHSYGPMFTVQVLFLQSLWQRQQLDVLRTVNVCIHDTDL